MSHLPWGYGLGFHLADRPDRAGRSPLEWPRLWWERLLLRPVARAICDARPDLIVNTHYVQGPVISRLIDKGALTCRQVHVVTDVAMHRWWYARNVAHWFVPQQATARRLERWSVPPERYTVSGIPIHPKWDKPLNRQAVLDEWNLPADRPIVLISGGTEFIVGPIARIAEDLSGACPEAFLVVLAGRNKNLLARLTALADRSERVRALGYTDRINELVSAADLMITKPGGLITSECLAKAVPMLLIDPVPGQEGGNAKFFAARGVARIAKGRRRIVAAAAELLSDPDQLACMSEAARALHRPGRQIITARLCQLLDSSPPA
jgi:processive 1,2-diacylglycerol beta-glucosyltransferase